MKFRTEGIRLPPIVKLSEAARKFMESPDFLDLGQGLPGHIPPHRPLIAFSERILHPAVHRYTPDQGHFELREELALYLRRTSGVHADPHSEVTITAGANQAFAGAVLTIVGKGDNLIIPSPYYFNSVMAVQLVGGKVVDIPVGSGFQPVFEDIAAAVTKRTRGILLVSPNNPTGAVYNRQLIDQVVDLCIERDIMLISDETYSQLVYDGSTHYSPRSRKDARDNVVTLGSFSKDFGMSGWRTGYLVGPSLFIEEFMKVQDTVTICAPTPGQFLALEILKTGLDAVESEIKHLGSLRDLAYMRIDEIDALETVRTGGTFYIFPRVKGCTDSRKLVLDILQSTKTLVLPGTIFGDAGEGHIRLSIGPLTPEAIDEAFDRLAKYFNSA
ncbi:MAG: pyridoxal phosphate-dependent aminotransferase [Candidatus Thorarchaeota archaeon]|nr:pyridoxal phosphate-dependent aminotransferase [Candidatus Thorarchaeota archaeon]